MAKRIKQPVPSNVYQHKVLGRVMCEWHPDGILRVPTKKLHAADVHMLLGSIVQTLTKHAPEVIPLLQSAFNAHVDMARRGALVQKEMQLETGAA